MYDLGYHLRKFRVVACKVLLSDGDAAVREENPPDEIVEAIEEDRKWKDEQEDEKGEEERT